MRADPSTDFARLRHAMLMTAVALVVALIGLGIRRMIVNLPARSADGCRINPLTITYRSPVHVIIYERVCPGAAGTTLNASVLAADDYDTPTTPGNALVLDGSGVGVDNVSRIRTDRSETADIALLYDRRERVLSQHVRTGRFTVEFRPTDRQ